MMKKSPRAPMILNEGLTGRLRDGLLRINAKGQVRSLNAAAQPWLRECVTQSDRIGKIIAAVKQGLLTLPYRFELFDNAQNNTQNNAPPPSEVWLDHDGERDYVLLILPKTNYSTDNLDLEGNAALSMTRKAAVCGLHSLTLLGAEVRAEMSQLRVQLAEIMRPGTSLVELRELAAALSIRLGEVSDLAALYQQDLAFTDERFALAPLIAEIYPTLPRQQGVNAISYHHSEGASLGQIYGHRAWMGLALIALLGRLGEGCPAGFRVNTSLRQLGDFVIVAGNVAIDRAHPAAKDAQVALPEQGFGLSLQICQRVFELHGGQLRIDYGDAPSDSPETGRFIVAFTLTLPTGLPTHDRTRVSCRSCRISEQAMETARDLVKMMSEVDV
jgi:hypothetical protein